LASLEAQPRTTAILPEPRRRLGWTELRNHSVGTAGQAQSAVLVSSRRPGTPLPTRANSVGFARMNYPPLTLYSRPDPGASRFGFRAYRAGRHVANAISGGDRRLVPIMFVRWSDSPNPAQGVIGQRVHALHPRALDHAVEELLTVDGSRTIKIKSGEHLVVR
jgi:hypothetical protein